MEKVFRFLMITLIVFAILMAGCNSCKEKEGKCCVGKECSESGVACLGGTHVEFKGCNDMCVPQTVCTPN